MSNALRKLGAKPVHHLISTKGMDLPPWKIIWKDGKPYRNIAFHYTVEQILLNKLLTEKDIENLTVVTIIRNPLDSAASQYQKLVSGTLELGWKSGALKHKMFERYKETPFDFSFFLRNYPSLISHSAKRALEYTRLANIVMRFETLQRDWQSLCQKFGLVMELPHKNATPNKKHFLSYYSPEDIVYVKTMIGPELKLLGY